jgi:excisionase family DNA binding protein
MEQVLRYNEAAALLGVSKRTLEKLVHDGRIKPKRIYRRVVFPLSVLESFLKV